MSSLNSNNIILTSVDSVYSLSTYILFAYLLAIIVDKICIKIFNSNNDSKSNIRLVIESAIQLGLTAALCYPARKIIDNMPFITTDGYTKMKLKDYEQGGVIWSSFVLIFEKELAAKLKLVQSRVTNF